MSTRAIQVEGLRPAQIRALSTRATRAGKSMAEYVRGLIERDLLSRQSFDVILAPVRADVEARGVTEEQIDAIVRKARRAPGRKRGGTASGR